jgi:hypothetical protein
MPAQSSTDFLTQALASVPAGGYISPLVDRNAELIYNIQNADI